jgi:plastocyanin
MRKALVIFTALAAAVSIVGPAAASGPTKKKPVKLEGKVTNKGTGKAVDGQVEMKVDNFFFEDTFIKAKKGETVTVTITNEGGVQHTFTIDKQDIDETLDPGDSATIDVDVPANGKPVAGYCRFHKGSGMQFAFFSKSGGKTRSEDSSDDGGSTGGYGY